MVSNVEIIDFVTSRIVQDLEFLASHGFISRDDQNAIRSRLPANGGTTPKPFVQQQVAVSMPMPSMQPVASPTFPLKNVGSPTVASTSDAANAGAARRAVPPPPPQRRPEFCKASWDYNLDGSEPNDLTFRKGDVIEISEETNADWWTGICRGRAGLFPSNHVTKIPYDPHIFPTPPDGGTSPPSQVAHMASGSQSTLYEKPRYPGSVGQQTPMQSMTPQPIGASPNVVPPMDPNQQAQQQAEPGRKSKFGKVGGQLGNAMVNGVGFGAGAAIGGGIIDAIF